LSYKGEKISQLLANCQRKPLACLWVHCSRMA